MVKRRPNVLFLMTDEHRADVVGYEGNGVVRTPTLDRLAGEGVVFRHAYTPAPACVPARMCLAAGQLPKTCGCEGWLDLAPGYRTFSRVFTEYGYETVCIGKLHHQGSDQMQGWRQRPIGDLAVIHSHFDMVASEFSRYWEKWPGQKWTMAKEIQRAGIGGSICGENDKLYVRSALNFIREYFNSPYYDREQGARPLLLKVSLNQPHYPFMTSEELFNYYLNRVEGYENETVLEPPMPVKGDRRVAPGRDVSRREMQRALAAYYGNVERVDGQFGEVLAALAQVGQDLDDWIIVYTSDHGDMMGEHQLWEKGVFYEGSVRVPLIIRWPGGFSGGQVVEQNVSLCDLFATLCELAELAVPEGLDSRSMKGLLCGDGEGWPDEVVSQWRKNEVMIKSGDLKYIYVGMEQREILFDLKRDPHETTDYAGDGKYSTEMARFRRRLAEMGHEVLR